MEADVAGCNGDGNICRETFPEMEKVYKFPEETDLHVFDF